MHNSFSFILERKDMKITMKSTLLHTVIEKDLLLQAEVSTFASSFPILYFTF